MIQLLVALIISESKSQDFVYPLTTAIFYQRINPICFWKTFPPYSLFSLETSVRGGHSFGIFGKVIYGQYCLIGADLPLGISSVGWRVVGKDRFRWVLQGEWVMRFPDFVPMFSKQRYTGIHVYCYWCVSCYCQVAGCCLKVWLQRKNRFSEPHLKPVLCLPWSPLPLIIPSQGAPKMSVEHSRYGPVGFKSSIMSSHLP